MYNIKTLNKISPVGLDKFASENYNCGDDVQFPDAIMVRSASMHEYEFEKSLKCIARAGAGVNNIPLDKCAEQGIVVFNTPGANANAVKELVILSLLLSSRKITSAMEWVKTLKGNGDQVGKLCEKGKSQFVGPEIKGKRLGVVGLGAIGVMVCNAAVDLGMKVYGYDPYVSIDNAWNLSQSVQHAKTLKEIYENCDYITLHVPATSETKGMINSESIAMMKSNVRIINLARGELVVENDIVEALEQNRMSVYVTDFCTDNLIGRPGVILFPPSRRIHSGIGGQRCKDGGKRAHRLPGKWQHRQLGQHALRVDATQRRHPHLHHSPQRKEYALADFRHHFGLRSQH